MVLYPPLIDYVVGHHRLRAVGKISGHLWPPTGVRPEQGGVDRDRKVLPLHDVSDPAQAVLPALGKSCGIERSEVKLNPRCRQIDPHPVDQAAALLGRSQPFTAVNNPLKYFGGRLGPVALPENRAAADQGCPNQHCHDCSQQPFSSV